MKEMENTKISLVIRSGIKIIQNTIEGVTIKILDEEMSRSEPTEFLPLGALGVNVRIDWEELGSKDFFLTAQLCEDMHSPYGDKIAEDFIFPMFREEMERFTNSCKEYE
jgi:hypothetical protein